MSSQTNTEKLPSAEGPEHESIVSKIAALDKDDPRRNELLLVFKEKYESSILAFCMKRGLQFQDAEDVFQEVFMAINRSATKYDPNRPEKPWIFRIAANKATSLLRKKYSLRIHSIFDLTGDDNLDSLPLHVMDAKNDPAHELEEREMLDEQRKKLAGAMQHLPLLDRKLLELRSEGLSVKEILGKPEVNEIAGKKLSPNYVHDHVFKAKQAIRLRIFGKEAA